MGTRADFYKGIGKGALWLGSIAWDGYPEGIDKELLEATTEEAFESALASFAESRFDEETESSDWTKPSYGWPWPWKDSQTTDFAYCFNDGKVEVFCFGRPCPGDDDAPKAEFPDMSLVQRVTYGPRSGVIVLSVPKEEEDEST